MKDKNILNNVGKSVGNGSKATLPNGENLSDKIQQNKVNQGVNGTNKFQSSNNSSLGMDNSNDDKKETKSKEEQAVGNVASEALKTSLKASFPYIPQFVINKLVDSKLGQTLIERQLREIKTKMIFGIIGVVITVLLWLFIMSAMVALIMAPVAWIDDATSNIGDFFGKLGNWFTGDGWCVAGKCNQNAQAKYYETLTDAIKVYKEEKNCPINEDLITATIFYGQMVDKEENDSEQGTDRYFDYLDVDEDVLESPTAYSKINVLIGVYLKGEEATAEELEHEGIIDVGNACSRSAIAYRNYLINSYIEDHYDSAITSQRTVEDIADEILMIGGIDIDSGISACSNSCTYNIDGKSYSEIEVKLWDTNGLEIPLSKKLYFEDYIVGVVYGEVGTSASSEVWKAHAIAARSSILASASSSGNIKIVDDSDGKAILYIKNNASTHIYCDPEKGCAELNNGTIIVGTSDPNINPNPTFIPKYGIDSNSPLKQSISEVVGMVVLDSSSKIVNTTYKDETIEIWKTNAQANKSYTEILGETYTSLASIEEGNCSALCSFAAGPYTEWKQYAAEWKDVPIATSTIGKIGCLTTSVCMQIARSGVDTPLGENFNPGTLVRNYGSQLYTGDGNWRWYAITNVIPGFVYSSSDAKTGLLSLSNAAVANIIIDKMSQGCYLVAEVKKHAGGQHWVAIDNVLGEEIYIMDPYSNCKTISECGSKYKISQINCYKVKK